MDYNAAQIATLFSITYGLDYVDLDDNIVSYVRGYEKTTLTDITKLMIDLINMVKMNK